MKWDANDIDIERNVTQIETPRAFEKIQISAGP